MTLSPSVHVQLLNLSFLPVINKFISGQQIHALVMSLNYTGIEIKTAHSLESWSGGVIVMVSGSVQIKDYNRRRKFMQTFFLAPQEKGFFVLNDLFHFVEEEPIHHHQAVLLAQSNLDSKLNAPISISKPGNLYCSFIF